MKLEHKLLAIEQMSRLIRGKHQLSDEDATFLADALHRIALGEDPTDALDVKARRGEKRSIAIRKKHEMSRWLQEVAIGWIEAARAPEAEEGLGLTLEKALSELYWNTPKRFGFTEETLKSYYNRNIKLKGRDVWFTRPESPNHDLDP